MYNLYIDEKRRNNISQKLIEEKNKLIEIQKHKITTDNLYAKYQNRIKKFMIEASNNKINYSLRI